MPASRRYGLADALIDEPFPDLGALSDDELKSQINKLVEEERLLHSRIDIFRSRMRHCGVAARDVPSAAGRRS